MKRICIFFVFLFLFVFSQKDAPAQESAGWTPVLLTVSGGNSVDGVEVWWTRQQCESFDMVFIRFVNTNNYPVRVTWDNEVFTRGLQWVKRTGEQENNEASLGALSTESGSCLSGGFYVIFLKDFISNSADFYKYGAKNFTVTRQ
jgi:hypothetical protein